MAVSPSPHLGVALGLVVELLREAARAQGCRSGRIYILRIIYCVHSALSLSVFIAVYSYSRVPFGAWSSLPLVYIFELYLKKVCTRSAVALTKTERQH